MLKGERRVAQYSEEEEELCEHRDKWRDLKANDPHVAELSKEAEEGRRGGRSWSNGCILLRGHKKL
jgi:hypothetical protein